MMTADMFQDVYGSEVMGNHDVLATYEDGAMVCRWIANDGTVFYFIAHGPDSGAFDICTREEALSEARKLNA